jgi:hypothetical protein
MELPVIQFIKMVKGLYMEYETEPCITQYFEMNDGEYFIIQNVPDQFSEATDQIFMDREMAIEMANYILKEFDV